MCFLTELAFNLLRSWNGKPVNYSMVKGLNTHNLDNGFQKKPRQRNSKNSLNTRDYRILVIAVVTDQY